jgi:hypothetical protein
LGDVRADVANAAGLHEIAGVITAIASESDATSTGKLLIHHLKRHGSFRGTRREADPDVMLRTKTSLPPDM